MPRNPRYGVVHSPRYRATARKILRLIPLPFCFLFALTFPSGTRAQNAESLLPGISNERNISGGETQTFQISLRHGQFLQLSIDKGDLNLAAILYQPNGQKHIEQNSHCYEPLDLSVAAWSDGIYKLQITSLEKAETVSPFTLKVEHLRAITTTDAGEEAARLALAAASISRAEWKESSLRKSIEKYHFAETVWLSSRNFQKAAKTSIAAGEIYLVLGDYRAGLECFQRAADEARRASDLLTRSVAFSRMARIWSLLGNNTAAEKKLSKAFEYYEQGAVSQSSNTKYVYAEILLDKGEAAYSRGNLVRASADIKQALEIFSEVGDRYGQARAHLYLGYIAGAIGQAETAINEVAQAETLYQAVGDRAGEAFCLTARGLSHSLNSEEERAITMHRQAREIFQTIGDLNSQAITINALGQAYEHLKDYTLALENYKEALRIFEAKGAVDFTAVTVFGMAGAYRMLGNNKLARLYYERCLRLSETANKTRMKTYALNGILAIYASEKNHRETLRQYDKILKFDEAIGDERGRILALNDLGDFLLTIGRKQEALLRLQQTLPLTRRIANRELEISTLYNLARACRDLGLLEEGLSYIKQSIEFIEVMRSNVASPEFRATYFAGFRKHYDLYIDLLMRLDRQQPNRDFATTALLASENARARTLLEILSEAGVDLRQEANPKILNRERELQGLLQSQARYQMDISGSGQNQAESAEVAQQIDRLRAEYQQIQTQLRNENPHLAALMRPPKVTLEEIQKQLRGNGETLLLEYALGDQTSYLWAVTPDSVSSYELPGRAVLESVARELYDLLVTRQTAQQLDIGYQTRIEEADRRCSDRALALSQQLLGPVEKQLGNKRLLIVAEGVLQYLPWDALPIPQESANDPALLLDRHEIVMLPSISTLAALRLERQPPKLTNRIVAVLADPVFDPDDDRLESNQRHLRSVSAPQATDPVHISLASLNRNGGPMRLTHTAEEADAIEAASPPGAAMIAKGFDANRETAMSQQVGQYQILHLATHGFINTEYPELSGVLLSRVSRDGNEVPGFLQLHDIYNLRLSTELTVLSACDTALGKDIKGEGLISLTRGFMHAGSRSVVASLWKVDDRATAVLMGYFYTAMLQDGLSPAAALRVAKQKMRQHPSWSAPYYWAGFIIQGEYNQQIDVGHGSKLWKCAAGLLAGMLILTGVLLFRRARRSL